MIRRTFWLGVGIGLIVTSLLLGLTTTKPAADSIEDETEPVTTEEQLRKMAEEHGLQLVSDSEYAKLTQERENARDQGQKQSEANNKTIYLYIPSGFSWQQTAEVLKKATLVDRTEDIMKQLKKLGREKQLQPGLYKFEADDRPQDIVETLSSP